MTSETSVKEICLFTVKYVNIFFRCRNLPLVSTTSVHCIFWKENPSISPGLIEKKKTMCASRKALHTSHNHFLTATSLNKSWLLINMHTAVCTGTLRFVSWVPSSFNTGSFMWAIVRASGHLQPPPPARFHIKCKIPQLFLSQILGNCDEANWINYCLEVRT